MQSLRGSASNHLSSIKPQSPRNNFVPAMTVNDKEPEVVLYDLACTENTCFSPVVWRIRLMLNYKNVPYRTVFLEFPDIEPTMKEM